MRGSDWTHMLNCTNATATFIITMREPPWGATAWPDQWVIGSKVLDGAVRVIKGTLQPEKSNNWFLFRKMFKDESGRTSSLKQFNVNLCKESSDHLHEHFYIVTSVSCFYYRVYNCTEGNRSIIDDHVLRSLKSFCMKQSKVCAQSFG